MGEKEIFIGKYLDRKLKNHNLPYGMQYFGLRSDMEEKAEKAWKRKQKKLNGSNN